MNRKRGDLMGSKIKTFQFACLSLILPVALPVHAQESEDEEAENVFEEVVVVGNRQIRLIDAAVPFTTITSEQIQQQAPRNIADALTNIPSLQVENTSGNTNNEYRFRGVGAGGTQFLEMEEDGIPIMRDAPDFLYRVHNGIDRIDTVRGGNSPILRTAAIGAVINFQYKEGDRDDYEGDLFFQTSDFGMVRAEGWLGGPINDQLTYSISGYYTTDDGVRKVDYPANEGYNLHGSLKYYFDDDDGYFKVSARTFNEGNIVYLGVPLLGSPSDPQQFPGGPDITTGSLLSREIALSNTFSAPGEPSKLDLLDGNDSKMSYVGTEFVKDWETDNGNTIGFISRNRYTSVSSRFSGYYAAGFALGGDFQNGESLAVNMVNSNTMGAGLVTYAYAVPAGFDPVSYSVTNQQGGVLDQGTIANWNAAGPEYLQPGDTVSTTTELANGNGVFMPVAAFDQDNPFTSFQQDLELNFGWESSRISHFASLGYYYLKMEREQDNRQQLFLIDLRPQAGRVDMNFQDATGAEVSLTDDGFLTHNHWLNRESITDEINAIYATYEAAIGDLTLDVGLRYDEFSNIIQRANTVNTFGDGPNQTPLPLPGTTTSPAVSAIQRYNGSFRTDQKFTNRETNWTIGANYLIGDAFGVYGRATQAFLPNPSGATESEIFELGLRYALDNFNISANLFSLTQEGDVQERGIVIGGEQIIAQFQTDRESIGLEIEADWFFLDGWALRVSGTFQDPTFASGGSVTIPPGTTLPPEDIEDAIGDLTVIDGNQIANQPEVLGNLTLEYTFDVGNWGSLSINGMLRHVGEVPLDDLNTAYTEAYTQVNAGLNFTSLDDTWYARLNVQNLTDEESIQRVFGGAQSIVEQPIAENGFYGRPLLGRNVVFGVGYRFY